MGTNATLLRLISIGLTLDYTTHGAKNFTVLSHHADTEHDRNLPKINMLE